MQSLYLFKTIITLRLKDYKSLSQTILLPIVLTLIFIQIFGGLESSNADVFGVGDLPYILEVVGEPMPTPGLGIAVAMLIFTALLGGSYGVTQIKELRMPIGTRILGAGISKVKIYTTYGVANVCLLFMHLLLVCIGYQLIVGIEILNRIDLLIIILLLMSLFSITLGSMIGIYIKHHKAADEAVGVLVNVFTFWTGGLTPGIKIPFPEFNPFNYITEAFLEIINKGTAQNIEIIIITMLGFSGIFIILSKIKLSKEGK